MARLVRRCSVVSNVRSSGSDRHAASYELSSSAAAAAGGSADSELAGRGGRWLPLLLLFPIAGRKPGRRRSQIRPPPDLCIGFLGKVTPRSRNETSQQLGWIKRASIDRHEPPAPHRLSKNQEQNRERRMKNWIERRSASFILSKETEEGLSPPLRRGRSGQESARLRRSKEKNAGGGGSRRYGTEGFGGWFCGASLLLLLSGEVVVVMWGWLVRMTKGRSDGGVWRRAGGGREREAAMAVAGSNLMRLTPSIAGAGRVCVDVVRCSERTRGGVAQRFARVFARIDEFVWVKRASNQSFWRERERGREWGECLALWRGAWSGLHSKRKKKGKKGGGGGCICRRGRVCERISVAKLLAFCRDVRSAHRLSLLFQIEFFLCLLIYI